MTDFISIFLLFHRHVGDLNVKCLCPYAYRGNKCETHEFLNDENGKFEKKCAAEGM